MTVKTSEQAAAPLLGAIMLNAVMVILSLFAASQDLSLEINNKDLFGTQPPSEELVILAEGYLFFDAGTSLLVFSDDGHLVGEYHFNGTIANFTVIPEKKLVLVALTIKDKTKGYIGETVALDYRNDTLQLKTVSTPQLQDRHFRQIVVLSNGDLIGNVWEPSSEARKQNGEDVEISKNGQIQFRRLELFENSDGDFELIHGDRIIYQRFFEFRSPLAENKKFLVWDTPKGISFLHPSEGKIETVGLRAMNKINAQYLPQEFFRGVNIERASEVGSFEVVALIPRDNGSNLVAFRHGTNGPLRLMLLGSDKVFPLEAEGQVFLGVKGDEMVFYRNDSGTHQIDFTPITR